MLWTECLCTPNFVRGTPNLQGDGIRRGGLWEVDGVMKVGALVNWTGALTKETPESSLAPPAV